MHYVLCDIHGNYERFKKMLNKIKISDSDILYIVGDAIDWGDAPISVLLDIMKRKNVVFFKGNHEAMMLSCKDILLNITPETEEDYKRDSYELRNWLKSGGNTTLSQFYKLDKASRQEIFDYLDSAILYKEIKVNDKNYILVHAGFKHFSPDRELSSYSEKELIFKSPDYDKPYFTDNTFVITGHRPTLFIDKNPDKGFIYRINNHIAIDCGCGYRNGRLGCIRLEDEKEFYAK